MQLWLGLALWLGALGPLLAPGSAGAEGPRKLQIGVKRRVENCGLRSRKGDVLTMHYTVTGDGTGGVTWEGAGGSPWAGAGGHWRGYVGWVPQGREGGAEWSPCSRGSGWGAPGGLWVGQEGLGGANCSGWTERNPGIWVGWRGPWHPGEGERNPGLAEGHWGSRGEGQGA